MEFKSPSFKNKEEIPIRHTKEGDNASPHLEWSAISEGVKGYALICEDPDASREPGRDYPFTHWLIYNISSNVTSLPERIPQDSQIQLPIRASQGMNSFGKIGYDGPYPPIDSGPHSYIFTLYAINKELGLAGGIDKKALLKALADYTLETAQITGKYERKSAAKTKKSKSSEREIRP